MSGILLRLLRNIYAFSFILSGVDSMNVDNHYPLR